MIFVGKKILFSKSDEKIVCLANCKNKKFVHKTGRKTCIYLLVEVSTANQASSL